MKSAYRCRNLARRDQVAGQDVPAINGIDYLEVDPADQRELAVHFLFELPKAGVANPVPPVGAALTAANVKIDGGARIRNVAVAAVNTAGKVLHVRASVAGDFSTYTLRIVGGDAAGEPPAGFDPQLCEVAFSFKANCPSDFDCLAVPTCPPAMQPSPAIDYLAKDYASFRRLMLDRLSTLIPDWRERNAADLGVMLVELCAYAADHLSYAQDAAGTECYLGTARRRVSVRRHARLLDYAMHDGCNARAFVVLQVDQGGGNAPRLVDLPAGVRLIADGLASPAVAGPAALDAAVAAGVPIFETLHIVTLSSAHNEISFHTWTDSACCLPKGATRATLREEHAGDLTLAEGDLVAFEEIVSPTTGLAQDADSGKRVVVRIAKPPQRRRDDVEKTSVVEIEWASADALQFPLCISAQSAAGMVGNVSVARGNVVLADHGVRRVGVPLMPDSAPVLPSPDGSPHRYRPQLPDADITQCIPYDHPTVVGTPANGLLAQDPRAAIPAVSLDDDGPAGSGPWVARRDLLGAKPGDRSFVVEVEADGVATVRFGDGLLGARPEPGLQFTADYRVGNGKAGNVGAETITRLVLPDPVPGDPYAELREYLSGLRNPIAAAGGTDPESAAEVRQYAPQAFRVQQRAVTEQDYADSAQQYEGVQRAAARLRWTGSWYTMYVTVDRRGGGSAAADPVFSAGLRAHLELRRIAGYDLEITDPVPVPLAIRLLVCIHPTYFNADVRHALLDVFTSGLRSDGSQGFFHPDRFTFGQPLPLSHVVAAAMQVPGVASLEVRQFERFGRAPNGEIEAGLIQTAPLEVLRLDNDANFPENGKLEFDVHGGL